VRLPGMDEFFPGHLSAIPRGAAVAEARPDGTEAATAGTAGRLGAGNPVVAGRGAG
jgi:hypothetical protein